MKTGLLVDLFVHFHTTDQDVKTVMQAGRGGGNEAIGQSTISQTSPPTPYLLYSSLAHPM